MKIILAILIAILIFLIYNHIQISKFTIAKPIISTNKLENDLRFTQISDYHNNNRINKEKLFKVIKKFDPHLIFLTGDFIDNRTEDLDNLVQLLEGLREIGPDIYYVIGNHETSSKYEKEFMDKLEESGVRILNNTNESVTINGQSINLAGVRFYIRKENYQESLEGIDREHFTIMLSHSPNGPLAYRMGMEDLIITGHTHGGQVRLPFVGALLVPGQGFFPKYHKGIYKLDKTILYIDSGLGNTLLPLRLFNRVQISNIEVKGIDN